VNDATYLGARDTQEANRHEHSRDRYLVVTKLDPVKILHAQAVCGNKAIQGEDLVHLNRGDERAATLSNDMRDCKVLVVLLLY
jgi:hypothetical protein